MLLLLSSLAFAEPKTVESFSFTPPIYSLTEDEPTEDTSSSDAEPSQSDFKFGYVQGFQAARANTSLKKKNATFGSIQGVVYGTTNGLFTGYTLGFGGMFSIPIHIAANNIYVFIPVSVPLNDEVLHLEPNRNSEEVWKGYKMGYRQYARLHKRAYISTIGVGAFGIGMLTAVSLVP